MFGGGFKILLDQQAEREQPIDAKNLQLLEHVALPPESAEFKLQFEHINAGLALVNNTFKTYSLSIYEELSILFKESHLIFNQLLTIKNQDQAGPLHLFLREKFKAIALKSAELEKIKNLLDIEKLEKIVMAEEEGKRTQKLMELRFAHLNASQLVVLSDVVAFVRHETQRVKLATDSDALAKTEAQLESIAQGIMANMKARVQAENQLQSKPLSLCDSQLSLSLMGSMIMVPKNEDSTMDKSLPLLPFTEGEKVFETVREYYLFYLSKHGDEFTQTWAKAQKGYKTYETNFTWLERSILEHFNPETNPYIGIVKDLLDYTWQNYSNGVLMAIQDTSRKVYETTNDGFNMLRGNWLARDIRNKIELISQNTNYQKIEQDLADKAEWLKNYFINLNKVLQNLLSWEQVISDSCCSSLEDSWVVVSHKKEVLSQLTDGTEQLNADLISFEKALIEEKKTIDENYNNLTKSWISINVEKGAALENNTKREGEVAGKGTGHDQDHVRRKGKGKVKGKDKAKNKGARIITINDDDFAVSSTESNGLTESIEHGSPSQITLPSGHTKIDINLDLSNTENKGDVASPAAQDQQHEVFTEAMPQPIKQSSIRTIIENDECYKEWKAGGQVFFCYDDFIETLNKNKTNQEAFRDMIMDAYEHDHITLTTLIELNASVIESTATIAKDKIQLIINEYDNHKGKGFFRIKHGETQTISDLKILNANKSNITQEDIKLIVELRDRRKRFFRLGSFSNNSLSFFDVNNKIDPKKRLSHTEEAIYKLAKACQPPVAKS